MNKKGEHGSKRGFKVSFMGKIVVRCLSSYGWWLSLQLPLLAPHRFHLVVGWRGSSRLGKIRESMLAQFPPGLRSLQVSHREWSAPTKPRMYAFDLYSMTITHMEKCLESERLCLATLHIWARIIAKLMAPTLLSVAPEEVLTSAFWSLHHAGWHRGSPWPIPNLGLVYMSGLITSPVILILILLL